MLIRSQFIHFVLCDSTFGLKFEVLLCYGKCYLQKLTSVFELYRLRLGIKHPKSLFAEEPNSLKVTPVPNAWYIQNVRIETKMVKFPIFGELNLVNI